MTPDERARLLALVEQWRSGKSQDRWQSAYQNGKTEAFWECADELATLLPPVGQEEPPTIGQCTARDSIARKCQLPWPHYGQMHWSAGFSWPNSERPAVARKD